MSCGGCEQNAGNGIGDDGAMLVGEVLKGNTTLKALFVEGLWIVETHGFDDETQVICCGLTDNGVGDDGAMALAQSLEHNTTLTALYIGGLSPKHTCLLFHSKCCFSWIVIVQATKSLMTASVCLRA